MGERIKIDLGRPGWGIKFPRRPRNANSRAKRGKAYERLARPFIGRGMGDPVNADPDGDRVSAKAKERANDGIYRSPIFAKIAMFVKRQFSSVCSNKCTSKVEQTFVHTLVVPQSVWTNNPVRRTLCP